MNGDGSKSASKVRGRMRPARRPFAGWDVGSLKLCIAQFDSVTRRSRVKITTSSSAQT
jgi:hypothetical protein